MINEIKNHLTNDIIPFWENLRDDEFGGFYGYMDYKLNIDKKSVKGCILNSRITWFFANAYKLLGEEHLLDNAKHGYEFMKNYCLDKEHGGMLWSVTYDGKPEDTIKHTYNQAFSIYALSSYYDATGDKEALEIADSIYNIIETKCRDKDGYLEAFDRDFKPASNEKLSENGVMADRTMNTLLHVFEAYTEFYRVTKREDVKAKLEWILDTFADKLYNPELHRQEVFFDMNYNSLIDLWSYGHDIESSWLIDRGAEILGEQKYIDKMTPITQDLTQAVYHAGFDGHSLAAECEKGVDLEDRVWWVQAENLIGMINGYQHDTSKTEYLEAAKAQWEFIRDKVFDKRNGSEWFWLVDKEGRPYEDKPIVEPWKCPYHNGRMCIEIIRRNVDVA